MHTEPITTSLNNELLEWSFNHDNTPDRDVRLRGAVVNVKATDNDHADRYDVHECENDRGDSCKRRLLLGT